MSDAVTTAPGTPPIIRMEGVNKWYDSFQVLTDINLSVRPGERIVICGPSGSGKSTLIRCINRLETVQKGRIEVDGIDLTAGGKNGSVTVAFTSDGTGTSGLGTTSLSAQPVTVTGLVNDFANPVFQLDAGPVSFTGGVSGAASDINGDGFADILTGRGRGLKPFAQYYSGLTSTNLLTVNTFGDSYSNGIFVGA